MATLNEVLKVLLISLVLAPVVCCSVFAIIDKFWASKLNFLAKVAMAQAEALKSAGNPSTNSEENT